MAFYMGTVFVFKLRACLLLLSPLNPVLESSWGPLSAKCGFSYTLCFSRVLLDEAAFLMKSTHTSAEPEAYHLSRPELYMQSSNRLNPHHCHQRPIHDTIFCW